jgi:ParB family chromosome partitioning protein
MHNVLKRTNEEKRIVSIPMDMIAQNPNQPRKYFDPRAMEELKNSIDEFGLIQPITVRRCGSEYELVAGERRFRACQMLGYEKIPAVVINTDSKNSALLSLLENLHREDLSFFEIAQSYENLIRNQGMSELEAAAKTGKSRLGIMNKIRLLKLSPFVKKLVREYELSENQAKALLRITDEKQQLEAAQNICLNRLNLNQTYDLIDAMLDEKPKRRQVIRVPAIKDITVFKNTVKRSLDIVKKSGVDAQMQEKNFDWGTEYVIKIKNKDAKKTHNAKEEENSAETAAK